LMYAKISAEFLNIFLLFFKMMAASNQPIGCLAFEAVLYGWKSMPQQAKVHNCCVTAMLKNSGFLWPGSAVERITGP